MPTDEVPFTDHEGYSPVNPKRKGRFPTSDTKDNKMCKFSPRKARKAIFCQIKNRGLVLGAESSSGTEES